MNRLNGDDYDPLRDDTRLNMQYDRVFAVMKDGVWRTLHNIAVRTNAPEASVSAQLRHARKARFGSHTVNRKYVSNGLYLYQLIVNTENLQ